MKKLWMIGLLLGGCFEGGGETNTTNFAQNGADSDEDPQLPDEMRPPPDDQQPWAPDPVCYDLREQLGLCYEELGQGECALAIEAQTGCYNQAYETCAVFEQAVKDCLGVMTPDGRYDQAGCEDEFAALDACYTNLVPPDCSAVDELVANCFSRCDQLVVEFETTCQPPPPPGPDGYCGHLREALALCDAEHGGQNPMDPNGLDGDYACAPILEAFEQLCAQPPEPCPNGH